MNSAQGSDARERAIVGRLGHRGSTVGERIKEPVLSPLLSLLLSKTTGGV
jgi:hypothetical protein